MKLMIYLSQFMLQLYQTNRYLSENAQAGLLIQP